MAVGGGALAGAVRGGQGDGRLDDADADPADAGQERAVVQSTSPRAPSSSRTSLRAGIQHAHGNVRGPSGDTAGRVRQAVQSLSGNSRDRHSPDAVPTPTIDHVARRTAEGKTKREIIRCLKCYVIREVWHLLRPAPQAALTGS